MSTSSPTPDNPEPPFWTMDFHNENEQDLLTSIMAVPCLITPIVSEIHGGIIAYALSEDHANLIVKALNRDNNENS